ncbi:hypothetical protein [Eggerthella sinensis]|uniref:hypothetical protein n=1 Tax=Eggerthella sinensis TaxID=242230 RepID=UPI00248E7780|nr:hypothetical protein [Eggerthella sinensis]
MWARIPRDGTFYRGLGKLSVGYWGKPCECACMHCKGRGGGGAGEKRPPDNPRKLVSYDDAVRVARRFDEWRRAKGYDMVMSFAGGDTPDYPGVFDEMRFAYQLYGLNGFACNGMRMRTEDELDEFFREAKDAGTRIVFTTFYGTRAFHDEFARRRGDFDLMVNTAKAVARHGMRNYHTTFLSKSTTPYLEELIAFLEKLPGERRIECRPILNKTEVLTDECERYTRAEYEALPEHLRKRNHYRMDTRAAWRDYVAAGRFEENTFDFDHLDTMIDVGDMDLDEFYAHSVEEYLDGVIEAEVEKRRSTPSMVALAEEYAAYRTDSELLFTLFDMQMEWKYLWRQTHPGIIPHYAMVN